MMAVVRSPYYRLADHLLRSHGGIETFVSSRRDTGRSWRLIALEMYVATKGKIQVSNQTLINWFPEGGDDE